MIARFWGWMLNRLKQEKCDRGPLAPQNATERSADSAGYFRPDLR